MRRLPLLAWVVTVAVALFALYRVKYEVQSLHAQVVDTERQLENEREALHVVAAEWAYLNRPERLRQLSSKYLSTTGLMVDQIAEMEAIPYANKNVASLDTTPAHFKEEGE
jgi:hypothetical protein